MRQPGTSLHFAISEIGFVAEGARLLVRAVAAEQLNDRREELQALEAATAVLDVLVAHVLNIQRVLRGEADARVIRTAGNLAPLLAMEGQDLVLEPWEHRRTFEQAKSRGAEPGAETVTTRRGRGRSP